jgi:hypothetical protein
MKVGAYRAMARVAWVGMWLVIGMTTAKADGFLPIVHPYESFNGSPFKPMNFNWFHLIKMTDLTSGLPMTAPGATASPGAVVIGPGSLVDSVDGSPTPNDGHSLFSGDGPGGINFTFDAGVLGSFTDRCRHRMD